MEHSSSQQKEAIQTAEVPAVESSKVAASPSNPQAEESADDQRADSESTVTAPTATNVESEEDLSKKVCEINIIMPWTDYSYKLYFNYTLILMNH